MSYKGRYRPSNPKKYKGNPSNIVYRSLWERKFMVYCDNHTKILEWGSEEIALPYRSPIDNKVHRYFPDFYIKVRESNGKIKRYIIEIKPKKQTQPPKERSRKTKKYLNEVMTYVKNVSKWEAATAFAGRNGMTFQVWNEDTLKSLGIKLLT